MKIDGECLCRSVTYGAEVDPSRVVVCHCTDCQTQTGAFRTTAVIDPATFEMRTGELKIYEKRAESGRIRHLAFCPECGTGIYGGPGPGETGFMSLRVGPLRQRAELRPVAQLWCRSAQGWLEGLPELTRFETQPGMPSE